MSTLKKIFVRETKGSMEDVPNFNDPELGHVPTAHIQTINVRQHPYQRAQHRSWGSYGPIHHSRVHGQRHILSRTSHKPSSARSAELRVKLPSPLLSTDTANTRVVARASYSDSEFSEHQIPVSPERYEVALNAIEGNSPSTPQNSNLHTLEDSQAHESRLEVIDGRFLGTDNCSHPNISIAPSVLDPSSKYPSDLAWSPPLSDDETQNADLISHSNQNATAFAEPSRPAGCPRHLVNAVDLPYAAQTASSYGSISTSVWNTSSQLAENSEHVMKTVQLPPGPSASSSGLNSINPDASCIDVKMPEGNNDNRSSRILQSASGSPHSDFINEDTGLRKLCDGEIEAELQATMHPLGEIPRSGQTIWSLSQESSQAQISVQLREDGRPMAQQHLPALRPLGQRLTKLGPGSSQTSSSMSADQSAAAIPSHGGGVALYKECSSSSQFRSPAPPLLFERRTISSHRMQNSEGLAQSYPFGSAAEDWETVSDMKSNMPGFNNDAVDTQMGSSVADNSSTGDGSVIEPNTGSHRKLGASQHPELPRHHQAFVITNNNRSGIATNIPLCDFEKGRLYQHPIPMAGRHLNPFISSPPAIQSKEDSTYSVGHGATLAHQVLQNPMSATSSSAGGFDKLIDSYVSINDSRNRQDVANLLERMVGPGKQEAASQEPSRGSSAWLSTVSESASGGDPLLPTRSGSFAKVTVLNGKGNLTGTPEGTGAREVGSSLAGASSPRDQFSSSPVPHLNSVRLESVGANSPQTPRQQTEAHPLTTLQVPSTVASRFHTPTHQKMTPSLATSEGSSELTSGVQTPDYQNIPSQMLATPNASSVYSSKAQSPCEYPSAASGIQSRLTSSARVLNFEGPSKQRRRRSSSESSCRVVASSSTTKASAIPSPELNGHKKRNTMVALLSNHSPCDDSGSENSQHQKTVRGRQGHQDALANSDILKAYTESIQTATSRSILHDGVVCSDVAPPVFVHPVYGNARPLDCAQQQRDRDQTCLNESHRPVARVESPHLHSIPHIASTEVLERREQISKLWLPIFCAIPPCALIFGYGYADEIMRIQSGGEANSFTDWSKMFAVFWALSATPVTIVVAVVCVVFGSSA